MAQRKDNRVQKPHLDSTIGGASIEREITEPVDLCLPSGRLNPEAVGWTRTALHRTNLRGWGRNKRFEYWAITTPEALITLNISHHDYRANVAVTYMDRSTMAEVRQGGNTWLPGKAGMRDPLNMAPMEARRRDVMVRLSPSGTGTRLYAESKRLSIDIEVIAEADHESMGVVVPWSSRRFQYTKKDNCLRAQGTVTLDGVTHKVDAATSQATHDRGRGRWPYFTFWNWGAGIGTDIEGHEIGLQFGGKWTDGTPSTENWIRVNGRLHKISDHLDWQYDTHDWLLPWTITGPGVSVSFKPVNHVRHMFNRWIVMSRGDSCVGYYSGKITADSGKLIVFQDVFGHVEEVERRW